MLPCSCLPSLPQPTEIEQLRPARAGMAEARSPSAVLMMVDNFLTT